MSGSGEHLKDEVRLNSFLPVRNSDTDGIEGLKKPGHHRRSYSWIDRTVRHRH